MTYVQQAAVPATFSTLTAEIVTTAMRHGRMERGEEQARAMRIAAYIDDIFVFVPSSELCAAALASLQHYCSVVGIFRKTSKARPASQLAPLLAWVLNTRKVTVSIPADKRYNTLVLLTVVREAARQGRRVPQALLDRLVGKLANMLAVAPHATARLVPLWGAKRKGRHGSRTMQPQWRRSIGSWSCCSTCRGASLSSFSRPPRRRRARG